MRRGAILMLVAITGASLLWFGFGVETVICTALLIVAILVPEKTYVRRH